MDERKAIQRLKKSDISGLEILVAKYQVKAVRTAYLITRDRVLAEDIVQDAFIQAYRSIHSFDTARAFEPWFITIVVNKSLKALRRSDNHVLFKEKPDEIAFTELFENVQSVESQIESREFLEQIWNALQKLSPAKER